MNYRKPNQKKTAAELMESLQKNPAFLNREKERESKRKAFEAVLSAEERPFIDEMRGVGDSIRLGFGQLT
ncbi:hypothetical protein FJZ31_28190 [Candidatus Poribacteria bacterium]|nr:hypothetical protein [Candidatus Poribacteria bacterium]